jgi:hypothetical protein
MEVAVDVEMEVALMTFPSSTESISTATPDASLKTQSLKTQHSELNKTPIHLAARNLPAWHGV